MRKMRRECKLLSNDVARMRRECDVMVTEYKVMNTEAKQVVRTAKAIEYIREVAWGGGAKPGPELQVLVDESVQAVGFVSPR